MAINPNLGTFLGHPVKHYAGGHPVVGDMVVDHETLCTKIWDGKDWYELSNEDMPNSLAWIESNWHNRNQITDEYLEDEYPDLKALKEQYEEMRDKLKTFEILRKEYGT